VGHPRTAHQLGLADIERGDPFNDLLVVLRLGQHQALLPTGQTTTSGRPQEPQGRFGI
jgi:hypothetical protein